MKRRHFLKIGAAAGLAMLTPWHRHALASEDLVGFDGPYWMTINLRGAWDATVFCDPKGDATDGSMRGPVNSYMRDDIIDFPLANGSSVRLGPGDFYEHTPPEGGAPVHVLRYLEDRGMTILNGVDAGLTNHRSGEQLAMAGSTAAAFPTLPALVAYHNLVDRPDPPNGPMPLLSFGGYDGTANLIPATRLTNLATLNQITQPDHIGAAAGGLRIHGETRQGLISDALLARRMMLEGRTHLPDKASAMSQLFLARAKEANVGVLLEPGRFDPAVFESLPTNSLEQQSYMALKSFQAGLAVSANLQIPGWDSHTGNDTQQASRLTRLFQGLMYIKHLAEQLELPGGQTLADRLNIIVGSDFGRTTFYKSRTGENVPRADSGKDHHSVTSWLTMLWAGGRENGIRVVGETNDAVIAQGLTPDLATVAPNMGTVMTPARIHQDLRRIAGFPDGPIARDFPLATDGQALQLWA